VRVIGGINYNPVQRCNLFFMFFCPIITQEPLDQFALNFDWGIRENHGNVLSLVFELNGSTCIGKNS